MKIFGPEFGLPLIVIFLSSLITVGFWYFQLPTQPKEKGREGAWKLLRRVKGVAGERREVLPKGLRQFLRKTPLGNKT